MGMMDEARAGHDLYAKFETSEGAFVVRLLSKDAPRTVENFVGLATGEKTWTHPITEAPMKGKPLYNGTHIHRCVKDNWIQGGDPTNTGRGGPGYQFDDELQSGRRFDRPGLLAMANKGPNTNGSQFIITVIPTSFLNDKHTIFGEVVSGQNVVDRIANVIPRNEDGRPKLDVVVKTVTISKSA